MDLNNPAVNLNLDDNSNVDDSFKQEGTTIHLEGGSSYYQNSANEKTTRTSALFKVLCVSIFCDVLLGWFIYTSTGRALDRVDAQVEIHRQETDKMLRQAREGNIWLIRYDIIRTIDLYEVRRRITPKEYTRLKDELQYYREVLKGNHGIQERWDGFAAKLLSGEVKMEQPQTSK